MKVAKSLPALQQRIAPLIAIHKIPPRIALHSAAGIILLAWKDIMYATAESNYTRVYATGDRHYIVSRTLKEVENNFPASSFFRIHQSHLVNLDAIIRVSTSEVHMSDHKVLPLARNKRKAFMNALEHTLIHI